MSPNLKISYLITGLTIVLAGGVILLAAQIWNPSWNPFGGVKKQIIENALEHTFQTKTYSFEEKIEVTTEKEEGFSLDLIGVVDQSDSKNIKTDSSLKIEIAAQSIKIQSEAEVKTSGDIFYLKLTSLPSFLPFFSKEILEEIKDHWVKIDLKELKEKAGKSGISPAENEALIAEMKELIKNKEFFEIKKRNSEIIDGVKTIHYSTFLKKETTKKVVPELLKIVGKYTKEATEKKDIEIVLKDFEENFNEVWQKISPLEVDFWLEKDLWARRIKFEKEFDLTKLGPANLLPISKTEKKLEGKLSVLIDVKFFDFNKKLNIEMPENYKTLEEILSSLMMSFSPYGDSSNGDSSLPGLNPEIKIPDFSLPDLPLPPF